jgi:hypothetical protein
MFIDASGTKSRSARRAMFIDASGTKSASARRAMFIDASGTKSPSARRAIVQSLMGMTSIHGPCIDGMCSQRSINMALLTEGGASRSRFYKHGPPDGGPSRVRWHL